MKIFKLLLIIILSVNANLWSVNNGEIIYNNTIPYIIRGINWNGLESDCLIPHGLWKNSLMYYINLLKYHGFNSIRTPISYELMRNLNVIVNPYCVTAEPRLHNITVEDFLYIYFDTLKNEGITVLVDLHTIDGRITEYPYDNYITYSDTIDAWVEFLKKFGDKIYAIELKNEPHGICNFNEFISWCKDAIYNIEYKTNYQGLYFISGTQISNKYNTMNNAWGGSFSDIDINNFPIEYKNRIVLSPHVYGTSVRSDSVKDDGSENWFNAFGFISKNDWILNELPIIYTEIGGFLIGTDMEYYTRFLNWVKENNLNKGIYWWTLPTTSMDTGGLFNDDNMNELNWTKLNFIKTLIPNPTYI